MHGGTALTLARWGIAATACLDAAILAYFASRDLHVPLIVAIACFAAPAALLIDFARHERLLSGLLALLVLIALAETERITGPSGAQHGTYASGAVLLGYLAGATFDKRFAVSSARAVLAGIYVSSAISKLRESGLAWLSPLPIQTTLAVLSPIEGWRGRLAHWVIEHPAVCAAIATATFVIELGAFFLMARGRLRQIWAALLIAMHLTITLLTPVLYERNMILLSVLCIAMPPERERDDRLVKGRRVARFGMLAAACVAIAIAATAALHRQPRRDASTPCHEQQIGSIAQDTSIGSWNVPAIERTECCAFIHLKRGSEEVVFVVEAAGVVRRRSPFDRDGLSISYRSTTVPYDAFRAAGETIARAVTEKSFREWLARPCR